MLTSKLKFYLSLTENCGKENFRKSSESLIEFKVLDCWTSNEKISFQFKSWIFSL